MRYLTKKHLSRRTLLRGAGIALGLPFLESMLPAGVRSAAAAGAPRTRLACIYIPHGCVMDQWRPTATGRDFELDADAAVARAVPQPSERRQRPQAARRLRRRVVGGREPRPLVAVLAHLHARRLRPFADVGRSARGAAHRPRDAAAVARARARSRLLDLVSHAANAAADGDESARRVRALARRRQHARGTRGAAAAAFELARFRDGPSRGFAARLAGPGPRAHGPLFDRRPRARAAPLARRGFPARRARGAREAERHPRRLRRARDADVRPARARVGRRSHAHRDLHDRRASSATVCIRAAA